MYELNTHNWNHLLTYKIQSITAKGARIEDALAINVLIVNIL